MKKHLIITHPGSAHFDEVAAIGMIMAVNSNMEFTAERREPTQSELDDPGIWVIDIGNRLEPGKFNFDHHQDPACPASFVLVADFLGIADEMSVFPWWRFKDSVDRIGPVRSSKEFNAGDALVNGSPAEGWLVGKFAWDTENSLPMIKDFGTNLVEGARRLKAQIDYWKSCRRLLIAGVPAMIGETRESAGLEEFRRLDADPPDIVISRDRRGDGWRLFRFDGAPVDFTRIADHPEILFAHKSGFLAATRELLPVSDVIKIVSGAVTKVKD